MAEVNTYFKMYRSILEWRWFKDARTLQIFVFLLSSANIKTNGFMGVDIHRGELATSYDSLAEATGMTRAQARTCIDHLKKTGEIETERHSKFFKISIVNYDSYQSDKPPAKKQKDAITSQSLNNHSAITSQSRHNHFAIIKECNNERMKECKKGASPPSPSAGETGAETEENLPPPAERFNRTLEGYLPEDWERENVPPNMWNYFESLNEWKAWVNK